MILWNFGFWGGAGRRGLEQAMKNCWQTGNDVFNLQVKDWKKSVQIHLMFIDEFDSPNVYPTWQVPQGSPPQLFKSSEKRLLRGKRSQRWSGSVFAFSQLPGSWWLESGIGNQWNLVIFGMDTTELFGDLPILEPFRMRCFHGCGHGNWCWTHMNTSHFWASTSYSAEWKRIRYWSRLV